MLKGLYEDKDIIVVVKPAGVESQAAKKFAPDMLSEIRKHMVINKLCTPGKEPYVAVIHRLDKPVSGVMVYAKTKKAAAALSEQVQSRKMDKYYEDCSVKSGFREVMDNRQTWKDFWLFNFAKLLEYCTLQQTEKCQLLQLLLDMFVVDNPMSARKHYKNMSTNHAYYIYMTHCFGYKTTDCAIFWLILANMSGNEGEQMDMTIGLVEEHLRFMVQLEEYLKRMFPGRGFGGHMQKYIVELLKYILDAVDNSDNAIANTSFIVNPVLSHS